MIELEEALEAAFLSDRDGGARLQEVLADIWDECADLAAHYGAYDGNRARWLADINPYRKEQE